MKVYIKAMNSCIMRRQKLKQYHDYLLANGHKIVSNPAQGDTILMWTCAFRSDVRDNAVSEIERFYGLYGDKLIVGGCLPDIDPDLLSKNFYGTVIKWRDDKNKMSQIFGCKQRGLDKYFQVYIEDRLCCDTEQFRQSNPDKDATFHDQFIKLVISEGCNYKCSYCSERLAFPPYRSIPEQELVESCRRTVKRTGVKEIILLADSLGDYGCDIGTTLPSLLGRLTTISKDIKIALNNLNPASFIRYYEDMIEFLRNGRIRHINLPIQSASGRILKLMNRSYSLEDIEKIFSYLNKINFREFDTHVIAGFPGETEEDFSATIGFILKHRPKYVLASAYMESSIMASYTLPGKIVDSEKRARLIYLERTMRDAGIICNADNSQLSADRLRRLNITS